MKPKVKFTPKNKSSNSISIVDKHPMFFTSTLLGILVFALYGWTSTFGWGLDDITFVYSTIKKIDSNWDGLSTLFLQKYGQYDYRPVTMTTFWLEYKYFGDIIPGKSHLINAGLYAILVIQLFRFVVMADFLKTTEKNYALAILAVFFFIIHPIHVGVVANIKSRDNLLSMLLGVTALIQFVLFFKDRKWYRVFLVVLFLLLALFSKADAYAFWAIMLLYFFVYKADYRNFFTKPNLLIVLLNLLLVVFILILDSMIRNSVTASNPIQRMYNDSPLFENDSFVNHLSFSFTTMLLYLKFLLIPHGYYFYFGYNQIPLVSLFSLQNIISFLVYVSIFIYCVKQFKTNKIYLFSFFFFLLSIAYAANLLVIVSGIMMDRYCFIASFGFFLGIAAFLMEKLQISNWKIMLDKRLWIVFAVWIVATYYRTSAWKDVDTLFNRDIASLQQSAQANAMFAGYQINTALFNNLSNSDKSKKMELAETYVDKALQINNKNKFALESKGICRTFFNDDIHAIPFLLKAINVDSNYTGPYNNLGIAYRNISKIDSALYFFGIAMNKEDAFSYPANNYVKMLSIKQEYTSIDSVFSVLLKRFPNDERLKIKIDKWDSYKIWEYD